MAYVPADARWFLAQLVMEIRVAGCKRNIVHVNYVLIGARNPEDAYAKAMHLGKQSRLEPYLNPKGQRVTNRFLGLRQLDVIHDDLEHGCEIMYREMLRVSPKGLRRLVRKKSELEAFMPISNGRPGRPDYASKEIMDKVHEALSRRKKP